MPYYGESVYYGLILLVTVKSDKKYLIIDGTFNTLHVCTCTLPSFYQGTVYAHFNLESRSCYIFDINLKLYHYRN